jgi:pimeloyl-ACP methyl ester carboxylesterase
MRRALALAIGLALAACSGDPAGSTSGGIVPNSPTSASADQRIEGLFSVGDHRLFLECHGAGSPTVVFLHGVGGGSADWFATLAQLPGVPACIYDRLNVGRSDHDQGRHQAIDSVNDLRALLDAAGVNPPYLLVGHSFGGMIALMFAAMHPDEVDGILLVDATLPFEADLDPPELRGQIAAELDANDEHLDFYDAYEEVGAVLDRVPPVPITYMFGTLQELAPEWAPGAYEEALHEFIDGLPRGRLVEEDSGHDMPIEIPDEIAEQTLKMFETIGT